MDTTEVSVENLEELIEQNMPFLIQTVSNLTGRYVSIENDEEFSIALSAFAEAVEKYNSDKGSFLSFVRLVIESRLKNHFIKTKNENRNLSLEQLTETGHVFSDRSSQFDGDRFLLREEILSFREELLLFDLSLDALVDKAPKHKDTRRNTITIADKASKDQNVVDRTYEKRRLPIRLVASVAKVTEKVVKRNKHFILATMLIFVKKFTLIIRWIEEVRCSDVS